MNSFLLLSFVSLSFLKNYVVSAVNFPPPGIDFCQQSDPNFNNCVGSQISRALKMYKDGVPELGIPKIEPFEIKKFEYFGESSEAGGINQKYTNMLTYGIYISEVYDPKFSLSKDDCFWDFMVLTPHMYAEADYEINGKLLVFPINGHGRSNISLTNLRNHHQATCEIYDKKGTTYLRLTKYQMDMRAEEIHFDFENIITGNEPLSQEVLKSLNENSQEIFRDVKNGYEYVWSQLHLQTANNVMGKIPLDQLFPK